MELIVAVDDIRHSSNARVLVISGAGRGFCSGADLSMGAITDISSDYDAGEVLERFYNPLIERLFALPLPVVASVHGAVAGAGCMIALAADLVLAARSAFFVQAFIKVGLTPDAGSLWLLPRLVGRARAQAMMMLGERIPAEVALDWGLIYQVVDDDQLAASTAAMAEKLAVGPTRAYELLRLGLRAALEQPLTEALMTERLSQRTAGRTYDFIEGVTAFRQKRAARFTGK